MLQCCMTGPAFEEMLEQAEASVVQAVMSSVVVFARMRGHQKGQVMDLLSRRGLHQTLQGQQRHLTVCMNLQPRQAPCSACLLRFCKLRVSRFCTFVGRVLRVCVNLQANCCGPLELQQQILCGCLEQGSNTSVFLSGDVDPHLWLSDCQNTYVATQL